MTTTDSDMIITTSPKMKQIMKLAESVAPSKATVLIRGESGTGKELLAQLIHRNSPRASKRFVAINCAAVPDGLLESELFGYERGAFTGAVGAKAGKFELAHDSTLLLDEMGELPLLLQAKLLRVLQEGEVEKLGGRHPVKVNVRVIATTNRDLREMVRQGQFREDLFYRLNVISIDVPPLRERKGDIELLANHFLAVSNLVNGRSIKGYHPEALSKLTMWDWPGNVRELENTIERSVLLCGSDLIVDNDLEILSPLQEKGQDLAAGMTLSKMEELLILKTLEHTRNNRTQAAKLLGISIRTLRNKIHEYRERGIL